MTVLIKGRFKDREIHGSLLCPPVTTWNPSARRWVEIAIYALDDGRWLVHRVGMSYVYHRANTRCRTKLGKQSGDPIRSIADLPDEAVPCERCEPDWPEDLPDTPGIVRFEFARHTFDTCPDAEKAYAKLTTVKDRDGTETTFVSDPVAELLDAAAAASPEFARFTTPVESIG